MLTTILHINHYREISKKKRSFTDDISKSRKSLLLSSFSTPDNDSIQLLKPTYSKWNVSVVPINNQLHQYDTNFTQSANTNNGVDYSVIPANFGQRNYNVYYKMKTDKKQD